MALYYLDASALVKLVSEEPESSPLLRFLAADDLVSSELVLTEVPRAIRRLLARAPAAPLEQLIARSEEVLAAVALLGLNRGLLAAAGALAEPHLRALDAIHVASAIALQPIDAFVSYDERQCAAARLAGLRTVAPRDRTAP